LLHIRFLKFFNGLGSLLDSRAKLLFNWFGFNEFHSIAELYNVNVHDNLAACHQKIWNVFELDINSLKVWFIAFNWFCLIYYGMIYSDSPDIAFYWLCLILLLNQYFDSLSYCVLLILFNLVLEWIGWQPNLLLSIGFV